MSLIMWISIVINYWSEWQVCAAGPPVSYTSHTTKPSRDEASHATLTWLHQRCSKKCAITFGLVWWLGYCITEHGEQILHYVWHYHQVSIAQHFFCSKQVAIEPNWAPLLCITAGWTHSPCLETSIEPLTHWALPLTRWDRIGRCTTVGIPLTHQRFVYSYLIFLDLNINEKITRRWSGICSSVMLSLHVQMHTDHKCSLFWVFSNLCPHLQKDYSVDLIRCHNIDRKSVV